MTSSNGKSPEDLELDAQRAIRPLARALDDALIQLAITRARLDVAQKKLDLATKVMADLVSEVELCVRLSLHT